MRPQLRILLIRRWRWSRGTGSPPTLPARGFSGSRGSGRAVGNEKLDDFLVVTGSIDRSPGRHRCAAVARLPFARAEAVLPGNDARVGKLVHRVDIHTPLDGQLDLFEDFGVRGVRS